MGLKDFFARATVFKLPLSAYLNILFFMKKIAGLLILMAIIQGCHKQKCDPETPCDLQKARTENAEKVTITTGVWGTVYLTEGNCMPVVREKPTDPYISTCKSCPVIRTVQIYEYTTRSQAEPYPSYGPYDKFNTSLVKEVVTDSQGFFQASLPAGKYSIVIKENGKLYAYSYDAQGGIAPVEVNGVTQHDVNINRASY
jgi:hypothetical protein